jgi:hypothetical protein
VTNEERERLMEDRIDTLRARSLDEQTRLEQVERKVEELERQVALLIARLEQGRKS